MDKLIRIVLMTGFSSIAVSNAMAQAPNIVDPNTACTQTWSEADPIATQLETIAEKQACIRLNSQNNEARLNANNLDQFKLVQAQEKVAVQELEKQEKDVKDKQQFLTWNWGIGIGAAFGIDDRIAEAEIVDGVVRVTKDVTDGPRVVLEAHNFYRTRWCGKLECGMGPFAAVNFGASDGDTLSSFGGGLMFGVKRADGAGSFNVGIGYMLDKGVKTLGDGFEKNQAPPGNETALRFKEETQDAWLIFVSTTF